jgi:hypothetical protein
MLLKKKQAARREIEVPEELYRYLLMSRARIESEHAEPGRDDRAAYWRNWVANDKEYDLIGHRVSKRVAEHVREVERENRRLAGENEALALFKERLADLGVDPTQGIYKFHVESVLDRLAGKLPPRLRGDLDRAIEGLQRVQTLFKTESADLFG